jgi:1-aminocyclopropane-1-carboxylate deaminase/D-cysteine desulfhydrase-like pyridoxal-dependent ACC family enzyme
MEWTEIILALLSGTTVASIVEAIRYRRQNKELKNIEVKKADVESQREQMDLASDYLAKVKELSELNYQATLKNGTDNGQIIDEIKKLTKRVADIEGCLNGKLKDYIREHKQDGTTA